MTVLSVCVVGLLVWLIWGDTIVRYIGTEAVLSVASGAMDDIGVPADQQQAVEAYSAKRLLHQYASMLYRLKMQPRRCVARFARAQLL